MVGKELNRIRARLTSFNASIFQQRLTELEIQSKKYSLNSLLKDSSIRRTRRVAPCVGPYSHYLTLYNTDISALRNTLNYGPKCVLLSEIWLYNK